ncbi:hypothetical protein LSH36_186g01066, partial [Paralvinella palmiformis]
FRAEDVILKMMREEDEVFLSDPEGGTAPRDVEYTRIFGSDDATRTSTGENKVPASVRRGDRFDDLNVVINDPKVKRLQRKRSSQRSESSEDDYASGPCGNGATKPLMHPRQRSKGQLTPQQRRVRRCCGYALYLLLAAAGLLGLAFGIVLVVRNYADSWLHIEKSPTWRDRRIVGCSSLVVDDVWIVGIPKLITESSFRLVDVNRDGVDDILFGFATGAEGYKVPDLVCDIYFNGTHPCLGGILALDGRDGTELWRHYSQHEIYAVNCMRDMDNDGTKDCLIAGRVGVSWVDVPDGRESYYSPVLYTRRDGTDVVLFGTGGETHPGSLWYIALDDLYHGDIDKAQQIIHNPYKGFMTPPVLLDLTGDGIKDLVFASYNSTVLAYDGENYNLLWNFSYPMSETYA